MGPKPGSATDSQCLTIDKPVGCTRKSDTIMSPSARHYDFYNNVVCNIPGWLHQGTAIRTMDMLEFQETHGVTGSLLEIGVMCGRYFSILIRSATRTGSRVVG